MEGPINKQENLDIKVRIAGPEDWEAYKDIRIEALTNNPEAFGSTLEEALTKTKEDWESDLSQVNKFFILAKVDSSLSGVKSMAGAFEKEDKSTWHIVGVYTRSDFRGRGVAEMVMQKVIEEIKRRGGKKATLNVTLRIEQEPARNLYKRLGFLEFNANSKTDGTYLVMEKDLNE